MNRYRDRVVGLLEILTAAFIWGSIAIFAIISQLPSPIFVFYRVLVVALIFVAIARRRIPVLLGLLRERYVIISSIMLALNWVLFFWAVELVPVATAVFIYYTGPVFATILAALLLGEKPSLLGVLAVLLALLGVSVMFLAVGWLGGKLGGVVVALGSGLAYGLLGVSSKASATSRRVNPLNLVFLQAIIAVVVLSPSLLLFNYTLSTTTVLVIVVVGTVHTLLALYLWYDSLRRLKVYVVSTISYLDPVFATILAYLVLDQHPGIHTIAGGLMVLVAGILASTESLREKTSYST